MTRRASPARRAPVRRLRLAAVVAAVWALGGASGCGRGPEVVRDADAPLQTSALRYTLTRNELGFRTEIPFVYHNRTGAPVFLPNCDGDLRPLLQMRRGDAWFDAWTPLRSACRSPAVVVAPGDSLASTLALFGAPAGSNVVPAFAFDDVEGVYRLLWDRALSAYDGEEIDPGTVLPVAQRVSNPFVLER